MFQQEWLETHGLTNQVLDAGSPLPEASCTHARSRGWGAYSSKSRREAHLRQFFRLEKGRPHNIYSGTSKETALRPDPRYSICSQALRVPGSLPKHAHWQL